MAEKYLRATALTDHIALTPLTVRIIHPGSQPPTMLHIMDCLSLFPIRG